MYVRGDNIRVESIDSISVENLCFSNRCLVTSELMGMLYIVTNLEKVLKHSKTLDTVSMTCQVLLLLLIGESGVPLEYKKLLEHSV